VLVFYSTNRAHVSKHIFHSKCVVHSHNYVYRLKPLDIEIMKRLGTRVNLIPVVAKADTLTQNDLFVFKQRVCFAFTQVIYVGTNTSLVVQVREVIAAQGIRIYQPPIEADDEATADHGRILLDAIPFSIIGSTEDVRTHDGRVVKGREYLWGVAEGPLLFSSWLG
jgi:cell division control protein 12